MAHGAAEVQKHVRAYIGVFLALAVLTVVTVAASYIKVSMGLHIAIALVIATIKASMVAAIFMHLKWERGISIWWTLGICAIFFAVLMWVPSLTVFELPPQAQFSMWDSLPKEAVPVHGAGH